MFQDSNAQRLVTILHLGRGLSAYIGTQNSVTHTLGEEPGPCLIAALLFLDCSSSVSVFPPFGD